jgi:toxin-antitoxin system PIN domain toxin
MILPDGNVLIYACRADSPRHAEFNAWLTSCISGNEAFGVSELVLSGVLRVLTHPRVFSPPTPLDKALAFIDALRAQPNCVLVQPGPRHWGIFTQLCTKAGAKGNLVADAYHAALAIEHGCEWITTDLDYSRFRGLRWRHPLD